MCCQSGESDTYVTYPITTSEVVAYLTAHGFAQVGSTNWYRHHSGHARVTVVNPDTMRFSVKAIDLPLVGGVLWQADLHEVPRDVFVATVTAAVSIA